MIIIWRPYERLMTSLLPLVALRHHGAWNKYRLGGVVVHLETLSRATRQDAL